MPRAIQDRSYGSEEGPWTLARVSAPGLVSLILALACFSACTLRADPQAALDHATQTFRHGDVAAAEKEAEKGYDTFHSLNTEWAWKFRLLQADALAWRGKNDQVLALMVSETTAPPTVELVARKERLEGLAYADQGLFPEAEKKLNGAEALCTANNYPVCSDVALARGEMRMEQGQFSEAQIAFEQALSRAQSQNSAYGEASALLSLSWSALQQEHFDEALDRANAAYQQSTAISAASMAQVALGNQGWAYYRLGEPEKALGLFLEARKRAKEIGAIQSELKWLTNAGYIYLDAQDYDSAEQSYRQALDLAQKINGRQDIIDTMMSLALVSERRDKLSEARDYADKTIALAPADGNRLDMLYPMLVQGHVAARLHDTDKAEKTFREIEQDEKSHVFLKWEAEHSLAQLYEDENKPKEAEQEYRAALTTFETARSSLKHEESSLPFPANARLIYDDYISFLIKQGKAPEALQVADYDRGQTLAEGLGLLKKGTSFHPDSPNAQPTARKSGGTIFSYWLGEKQSYLWVVTAQKTTVFTLPPKSEIEPKVQRYRKALSEQQEFLPRTDEDGRSLYSTLVAPAASLLAKDAKVFIIPDGALNTLNFETLLVPGKQTPRYWIEDVTIADVSSLRLLAASHPEASPAPSLLLLGNAVQSNPDYPELRKAADEMEIVEKHFPSRQRVFAREEATPTAYLTNHPEQFSYIHFVAHGTASRVTPLDSAIVLSKAGSQDDSFKLYARDIIHHKLRANLVTISTCYGAGTRAYSGEGLVGLSWAFLMAGAHNVIGALWAVSDVSTPGFMGTLYTDLDKGDRPEKALRDAKLRLLRSGGTFAKPFYWAPFQLYTGS